jgi:hypothetical protein
VNVEAGGRIIVAGEAMDLDGLDRLLRRHAARSRERTRTGASRMAVVFRVDGAVPWGVAAWLLQRCAHPDCGIFRTFFSVLPERGEEEGALAAFLPEPRERRGPVLPRDLGAYAVRIAADGLAVEPEALYERLAKVAEAESTLAVLDVHFFVPLAYVLRTVDELHRAGVVSVSFSPGPPPRPERGIAELIEQASAEEHTPGILLGGSVVRPGGAGSAVRPRVPRVRGGFAGTTKPPPWGIVWVEPPRPGPIEKEPPVIEEPMDVLEQGSPPVRPPEGPVDLALRWLADHQSEEGHWDCDGFMLLDSEGDPCDGGGNARYDPGVSGLALLAFLGAGETHRQGRYRETVRKGLLYLKGIQDPKGCFGNRSTDHFTYYHAIASLAMVRAYALTRSPHFRASAQEGLDFIEACRNPFAVWRYGVRPGDNDTSLTGWMLTALAAGQQAGLRVDPRAFEGARGWLERVTDPDSGRTGYTWRGTSPARRQERIDRFPGWKSEALTAVGVFCRFLLGEDPAESEMIRKGVALCRATPPRWDPDDGSIDMYYWYYGTLATYLASGEAWTEWSAALARELLPRQRKDGNFRGSWDPVDPWGPDGGRVYATAMCAMVLEVRDRYSCVFGVGPR